MYIKQLAGVTAASLFLSGSLAQAEENLWLYAKGTDTRPEGSFELKLSNISRIGKGTGDYQFHDIRPEIEYGVNDSLTIGAELMIFDHDYRVDTGDGSLDPLPDGESFSDTQFGGYELGLKYNILSPYKDFMGFSIGLGFEHRDKYRLDGSDIDQDSFTTTLFFQKNFLDDTLVFVLNPKIEFERRKNDGGDETVLEEEIAFDIAAGVSYRVAPKWFVGLEYRTQSDYLNPQIDGVFDPELERSSFDLTDWKLGSQHQIAHYFGPTIHYAEKEWWWTAGILWQIAGHGRGEGAANAKGRNWDEHERYHVGFSLGYEF